MNGESNISHTAIEIIPAFSIYNDNNPNRNPIVQLPTSPINILAGAQFQYKKPIVEGDYGEPLMTQKDIDAYMESVKDYYVFDDEDKEKIKGDFDMSSKTQRVKLKSDERHIIYQALGSRASTLRNQIGYNRVDEDVSLRDQITKHETLIRKLKNS